MRISHGGIGVTAPLPHEEFALRTSPFRVVVCVHRTLQQKTLKDTVVLIYANKTDAEGCMSTGEMVEGLEVKRFIGDREWHIQKTCAITGEGLTEGLEWLCDAMNSCPAGKGGKGERERPAGGLRAVAPAHSASPLTPDDDALEGDELDRSDRDSPVEATGGQ
jgi:hypothetical protein